MKTRYIFAIAVLMASTAQVSAQNFFSRLYNDWLTKPRNVDSTYVYQHHLGFSPTLTTNFSSQSVRTTTVMKYFDYPMFDEQGDPVIDDNGELALMPEFKYVMTDVLKESLSTRVGLFLAVGRLGLGWGVEASPDSSQKSSTFQLSLRGNKTGFNINYLSFDQTVVETLDMTPGVFEEDTTIYTFSGNHFRRLTVDGYYVLNTSRFAYPPGIAGNMVQIKSAGAWMLAGRFLQSEFAINPEEGFASYGATQISLGCGYSYTWVPFSHAPRNDGKGMYTFFLNGTIIPMLTLFNHMSINIYEDVEGISVYKRGFFCWPTPNVMANATIGVSWSRFYFGAQFNYNLFHFNTRNTINTDQLAFSVDESLYGAAQLNVMGVFYEWNVGLKFQACF